MRTLSVKCAYQEKGITQKLGSQQLREQLLKHEHVRKRLFSDMLEITTMCSSFHGFLDFVSVKWQHRGMESQTQLGSASKMVFQHGLTLDLHWWPVDTILLYISTAVG